MLVKRTGFRSLGERLTKMAWVCALTLSVGYLLVGQTPLAAETPRLVIAPKLDLAAKHGTETLVLAGGCFWGVQGVFQHVDGVINATVGYAGGTAETAIYEQTETGLTGHAEAVEIVYDPKVVSYGTLLRIFFSAAHDPTQVDRQGPDVGTQYRSVIFPLNDEQEAVAKAYIKQLDEQKAFASPVATTVEMNKTFYEAEAYHQDYMYNNPNQPYVMYHEVPKLETLKRLFPDRYRAQPRLVADNRS